MRGERGAEGRGRFEAARGRRRITIERGDAPRRKQFRQQIFTDRLREAAREIAGIDADAARAAVAPMLAEEIGDLTR